MRVVSLPSKDLHALAAALAALKAAAAAAAAGADPAGAADAKRAVGELLEGLEGGLGCRGALRGALLEEIPLEQALGLCRRRVEPAAAAAD